MKKRICRVVFIVFLVLFLNKSVYAATDAVALIPYLTEQITNQVKQLAEFSKIFNATLQQLNTIQEMSTWQRTLMEGLDRFTGNFDFADDFLDLYEYYDEFSYNIEEMQEQFDEMYGGKNDRDQEELNIGGLFRQYRARRRINKYLMARAQTTEDSGNEYVGYFKEWIKNSKQEISENGFESMTVEGLGHLGSLFNSMLQNQSGIMKQKANEDAARIKEEQEKLIQKDVEAHVYLGAGAVQDTLSQMLTTKVAFGNDVN